MKVLVVNVDSTVPNIALHKIKLYHQNRGDEVLLIKDHQARRLPIFATEADKIYVSCIFDYNKHFCKKWEKIAEIGGSGYDLDKKLPIEIDRLKPKLNLGFTTRGCIRNCYFCIVRRKEGYIKAVADIYDFWDGSSKEIKIFDNNILALPKHFFKITKQIKKEKLVVDFNQRLDFRLLTTEICKELFTLNHLNGKIRFAFDDISYKTGVKKALKMLKKNGLKDWGTRWYVYVGIKDTVETVLERVHMLRDHKQVVFLMRDIAVKDDPMYKKIYTWTSSIPVFATTKDFYEYDKGLPKKQKVRKCLDL